MIFSDEILNSIEDIIKDYKVYLVGGYLRNYFINNKISSDRDLVCINNAKNLAIDIADKLEGVFIELDSENEIYRVVLKDKINYFDIAHALDNDILKDAKRRDFTINSIFYDLNKKEIFDPLDGISDIKNKIIKTSDLQNMLDDTLRFLRIYRFQSQTGFETDKKLADFSKENFKLIKNVAPERINYEIIKIFEGEYLIKTLLRMLDDNVAELVFPFVADVKRVPCNSHHHLDLIHHLIETTRLIETTNPLLKLAAFYHDIGKPSTWTIEPDGRHRFIGHDIKGAEIAKKELEKLKFSTKQIQYITKMIKYHIYPSSLMNCEDNKKAYARFVKKMGKDALDVIKLAKADRLSARGEKVTDKMVENNLSHLEKLKNYYLEVESMAQNPKALLDGREVMEILNLKPSKKVGEILENLKIAQLSGEILTKEEAINYIKTKAVKTT